MAILLKSDGTHPVRIILAEGIHTLGSSNDSDQRIAHPTVSRLHLRIVVAGEHAQVEDLDSSNGSFVDGQRIKQAQLSIGQELRLGDLRLQLCAAKDADAEIALGLAVPASGVAPSTLPPGIGDQFTLRELPILLNLLADGLSQADLLRGFGAALMSLRGITQVQIRHDERIYFDSGSDIEPEFEVSLDELSLGISTRSGGVAQQYMPLISLLRPLRRLSVSADHCQPAQRPASASPNPQSLDASVAEIYQRARRAAESGLSILIRGESGTGKEVLARHIHNHSQRSGPLVALNCAAIPAGLLEAELFGIEKGVATGVEPRPGCFRRAQGGTLFLDEIGDMPMEVQAKILRALQEKEVHPVGAKAPIPVDVRVISATNRDLDALTLEALFRADLRHRIADWEVILPPLRERRADIGNLALHFLSRELASNQRHARGISVEALRCLMDYPWPGNIRELEREMARCAVFLDDGAVLSSDLLKESIARAVATDASLQSQMAEFERNVLNAALREHEHNASAAATTLGIARSTLYRRMQALGIS